MKKFFEEFKKFITRGNVVDMAVGVAVASAFTAIVTAFTKGFITPLLALLTDGVSDLSEMKLVIRPEVANVLEDGTTEVVTAEVALLWGAFVQKIIEFLIIALALFVVLKIATAVANYSAKLRENAHDLLNPAAAAAEAEAEAAAKAEAEAKKKAEDEAARLAEETRLAEIAAEKARLEREEALLTEIRDLLRSQQK